jgi:hypothetical protein
MKQQLIKRIDKCITEGMSITCKLAFIGYHSRYGVPKLLMFELTYGYDTVIAGVCWNWIFLTNEMVQGPCAHLGLHQRLYADWTVDILTD